MSDQQAMARKLREDGGASSLDKATASWVKARNNVRYWEHRNRAQPTPDTRSKLIMAQNAFKRACDHRRKVRESVGLIH